MENFFIDDQFCSDIPSLIAIVFWNDEDEVMNLPDDWQIEVQDSELEKIFFLKEKDVVEMIVEDFIERNDERIPIDDESGWHLKQIRKALSRGIDVEKINSELPELYYPINKFYFITKKDLINCI